MKTILSPDKIIDLIVEKLSLDNDNQLANYLGVERQQIHQFRKGKGGNLTCKLLTAVLELSS